MKKVFRWFVGIVVGAVIAAALGWFIYIPQYRPGLGPGERYGVDVSNHQKAINWQKVADDDIDFAYVKASEGKDFVDPAFAQHWEGARGAGLQTGAYHFFTLCSPAADQAATFVKSAPRDGNSLPAAVDLELAGNCGTRPAQQTVEAEVRKFVELVEEELGDPMILYVGDDFESTYHVTQWLDRERWVPQFMVQPRNDEWVAWQVMGEAKVEGIDGKADLNIGRPKLLR